MQLRNKEPDSSDESVLKKISLIVRMVDAEDSRKPDYSDRISAYAIDGLAKTA